MGVISTKLAGLKISFDDAPVDTGAALAGLNFMDFDLAEAVPNLFPTDNVVTRRVLKGKVLQRGGDSTPATVVIPFPYDDENDAHKACLAKGLEKVGADGIPREKKMVIEHDYGTANLYYAKAIFTSCTLDASGDDFLSGELTYAIEDNVWEVAKPTS